MDPTFDEIKSAVTEIYNELKENIDGEVASYIPQLAKVNPDLFGVSVCTVNGEIFEIGDTEIDFCLQSCSKPLSYCIARNLSGMKEVHKHVGFEPSGQRFNAFVLDEDNLPHNPMINAGAIMVCSMIKPDEEPAERFDCVKEFLFRMSGCTRRIGFDNSVFLSEKVHSARNRALTYFMDEKDIFPKGSDLEKTLDLYFQVCSITVNCTTASIISSTLANSGTCPITDENIFAITNVRDCLSLMYTCGMYDYSGQFAFQVGLPAKSGVSGCLMLIIPQKMGICIWSPRLDRHGNTVRGVEFCRRLNQRFGFHIFHHRAICHTTCEDKVILCQKLITAAAKGNVDSVKVFASKIDVNTGDYDGRRALHLAAAEGHVTVVEVLLELGADPLLLDRWGNTAYHEARKMVKGLIEKEQTETEAYKNFSTICQILNKEGDVSSTI